MGVSDTSNTGLEWVQVWGGFLVFGLGWVGVGFVLESLNVELHSI